MAHLKKHGLASMDDHDLTGLSQSGLVKADIENNSILTVLLEDIASSAKKNHLLWRFDHLAFFGVVEWGLRHRSEV